MTESFEDARIFAQVIMSDCDAPIISRMQRAHDHEMEQLRRSRFREGYEAGQRSMDAEHYAVALRLKHLPLDEDSHGNLSQIARAIWHSDFGWTRGACEALRDKLIELLGGMHEPEPIPASRCACDADYNCGHGDETEMSCEPVSQESPNLANSDGEDVDRITITNELRKFRGCIKANMTLEMVLTIRAEINCIADRIDATAKHERERDRLRVKKLMRQRDEFKRAMCSAQDLLEKRTDERDELQKKLDTIREALDG